MHLIRNSFTAVMILMAVATLGTALQQASAPPDTDKLMNPATLTETAPDQFDARFTTTRGTMVISVRRAWAPIGADRFYNLVKNGFYDNCRFYLVLEGVLAQFGLNGNPQINAVWARATIPDDPVKQSNRKGYVSFAKAGPNTRTSQVFINLTDDNIVLDGQGFAPFGTVTKGTDVMAALYSDYGELSPKGKGSQLDRFLTEGNAYLEKYFPKLDYIKSAVIVEKAKK